MSGNIAIVLVVGAILVLFAGVGAYYIVRYMRGSIKLRLLKKGFDAGEKVAGSFEVLTRKAIEGRRLYVALIGEEVTRRRQGDSTRTSRREIFRREETLEEARSFGAGERGEYNFEIETPSAAGGGFGDSTLGKVLETGVSLLGGGRRYLRWKVEVRLDAKGVDLGASKRITVNFG